MVQITIAPVALCQSIEEMRAFQGKAGDMVALTNILPPLRKMKSRRLRTRLQALILLAAVPSALSIVYFGIDSYQVEVDRNSAETRRITSQLVATQHGLIADTESFLRKLSLSEAVQDPTDQKCDAFLPQVLQLSHIYQNLGAPRWDGELLCNALPLREPVNVSDRPYFRRAMDKEVFSVGTFQTDRATGLTSVNFAHPIIPEGQKDPIGAVVAVLGLDWWSTHLMRETLPEGAVATITDRESRIVAVHPPDPTALGQSLVGHGRLAGGTVVSDGAVVEGEDGVRRVVSRRILFEDGEGQPIQVSLGLPVEEALKQARMTVFWRLLALCSLVAIFSGLALRMLEKQVLQPLGALNRAIQGFEKGKVDEQLFDQQGARISDFENISNSFRRMSHARLTAETLEAERRRQLQALLQALPDTYFRLSNDGTILEYKASNEQELLMPPEMFLGRRVADILPVDALSLYEANVKRFRETNEAVTWEYQLEINAVQIDFEARLQAIPGSNEMVLVVRNISEVKRAREKILLQARTDFLTRLPNRASLTAETEAASFAARELGQALVLMFVDLDGLKKVNDRMGHATGDGLLKLVAQRLRSCLSDTDFVARHAGDEFVILLCGETALERADKVSQRVLSTMQRPFEIGGEKISIAASIGIAHSPTDASTPQALLSAADQAMYLAKGEGGGRIRYYTPEIGNRNAHRLRMLDDLHRALEFDEFDLHYQPIINLQTGQVVLAEALLRWNHPEFGLLTPDRFLPFAEEAGLMVELGDTGLRRACRDLTDFRDRFGTGFQICVNHSPTELSAREHGHGLDWARYIKENTPHDASILIEITEAALLDPTPFTLASLKAFRESGIEVALDDFGAGYSSLIYFLNNEFDYLKIDREFAQNAPESVRATGLCETILGLSQRLGSKAIAEGIEREAQLRFFQQRGCTLGQGFLFSKALSKDDFMALPQKIELVTA